jgi:phosphate starvation-inducible PhoH-like protein
MNVPRILNLILIIFLNIPLFSTHKYIKKLDLTMKKEKKIKDTFMYTPKSLNQANYMESLVNDKLDLIIAVGPAGTGKTLFACLNAVNHLKNGTIKKLIITRPVVTVEEDIGFLPGNINKKMDPWTKPLFDLFLEFFTKSELDAFINNNIIEISPLAFMRGRTFKNAFIIADEMQNSSPNQMKMLTTRIGTNSKMVITGDLKQTDIHGKNGLDDLIEKINNYNKKTNNSLNCIKVISLEKEDIERSDIVKNIIKIYEEPEYKEISNVNKNNTIVTVIQSNKTVNAFFNTTKNIKEYYDNDNDAALIPKRQMRRNIDIFYDELY